MQKSSRHIPAIIFLAVGMALLLYGMALSVAPVYSEKSDKGFATPERQLVLEVSRGGLERKADGKLYKTYTGKPPAACPT